MKNSKENGLLVLGFQEGDKIIIAQKTPPFPDPDDPKVPIHVKIIGTILVSLINGNRVRLALKGLDSVCFDRPSVLESKVLVPKEDNRPVIIDELDKIYQNDLTPALSTHLFPGTS